MEQKKPIKYLRDCEDGGLEDWTYVIERAKKMNDTKKIEEIKKLKGWRKPK